MSPPLVRSWPVLAAALLLAASAAEAGAQAERRCAPASDPHRLPALSQLADSAALHAAVAADPALSGGTTLLTVGFTPAGALARLDVLESDVANMAARTALAGLVVRSVKAQAKADDGWSVRVRVQGGETPSFAVARSEVCPPVPLRGLGAPPRVVTVDASSLPASQADLRRDLERLNNWRLQLLVDVDGSVKDAVMLRSSGDPGYDSAVRRANRSARFQPGLRDGAPVPMKFVLDPEVRLR